MFAWKSYLKHTKILTRFHSTRIDVSPDVQAALKDRKPVVALESTIITHGMPNPQNLITAIAVEDIIREQVRGLFDDKKCNSFLTEIMFMFS